MAKKKTSLKKADLKRFQERLEEMRNEITRIFEGKSAEVKKPDEATGYSQHQADQGTDDFDRTIGLELTNEEYTVLKQVERALKKIDDGTYGICDRSGNEIPVARLEAVPYANMTVQAQEEYEKELRH